MADDDRTRRPRRRARPDRGPREGHRPRAVRLRVRPVEGAAYAWLVQATIATRHGRARSTPREALAARRRPRRHLPRERAEAAASRTSASCASCSRRASPTAARSSRSRWPRPSRAPARRPTSSAWSTTPRRTTSPCATTTPSSTRPRRSTRTSRRETVEGDVEAALAGSPLLVDETYTTPAEHNNPMEPHATLAVWSGGDLTLYDSTQGAPARAGHDRGRVRDRPRARARDLAARRRRVRLEGHPAPDRDRGRPRRPGRRPAGEARRDAAADVRPHGLPHADDPARAARRRRRRAAAGDRPRASSSRPRRSRSSPSRPRCRRG